MLPISPDEIISTIKDLQDKKSTDINDISVNFLKEINSEISKPLHVIFNLSIEKGIFPDGFKTSKTLPVYKRDGSMDDLQHYRPISLVNAFSKICEKIISKRLLSFLHQNNFFIKYQLGFLEGRSTEKAIIQVMTCGAHLTLFNIIYFLTNLKI